MGTRLPISLFSSLTYGRSPLLLLRRFPRGISVSPRWKSKTAGLIREGKTTQEIAESLCVSENTVSAHRFHIRKKLGLTNKKVNLRTFLKSLDK